MGRSVPDGERASGTGPSNWTSSRLAAGDDFLGELPVLHPVDVDRSFGERDVDGRDGNPEGAREEAQERLKLGQAALVEQEREQSEGADQALGLLAELSPAVEDPRPADRGGRK